MNCEELKKSLYAYLEQELTPEQRAAVEAHTQGCKGCEELVRTAGELSCKELADFLHEYVDGTLESERRDVFERHLGMCPPCIDFLESYKRTIELAGEACSPCGEDAPEVPPEIVKAILAARARERG